MLASLMLTSNGANVLIGYNNVSYESKSITQDLVYSIPVNGVHFNILDTDNYEGTLQNLNPTTQQFYDGNYPGFGSWISTGRIHIRTIISPAINYPFGLAWMRTLTDTTNWIPSGNQGFKTLAEWNALQLDVINGSKYNLTGTAVYG